MALSDFDIEVTASLRLWIVLHRARESVEQHLRRQVSDHGVSFTEFAVLEVLLHKGPLPIGEIGERVLLTSGSMTYVIDKLVQRGLIQRRCCEEDRRITYAELTDEGRSRIEAIFTEHAVLMKDVMAGLSLEEKQITRALLKRLGRYAEAFAPARTE